MERVQRTHSVWERRACRTEKALRPRRKRRDAQSGRVVVPPTHPTRPLPTGHSACRTCLAHLLATATPATPCACPVCCVPFHAAPPVAPALAAALAAAVLPAGAPTTTPTPDDDDWTAVVTASTPHPPRPRSPVARLPPAPALRRVTMSAVRAGAACITHLDPPDWAPDSHPSCQGCGTLWSRARRHHCRACGRLLCGACASKKALLPPKLASAGLQRVCGPCAALLEPVQDALAAVAAPAARSVVHDAYDAPRGWVRAPCGGGLEGALFRAAAALRGATTALATAGGGGGGGGPTAADLSSAAGVAIVTVARVGLGTLAEAGSGVVFGRCPTTRGWGPPVALRCASLSYGAAAAAALVDILLVFPSTAALASLTGRPPALSASVSASAVAGGARFGGAAGGAAGVRGAGGARAWPLSARGAAAGVTVEVGALGVATANVADFYGGAKSAAALLLGGGDGDATSVHLPPPPPGAAACVAALDAYVAAVESAEGVATSFAPATPPTGEGGVVVAHSVAAVDEEAEEDSDSDGDDLAALFGEAW